MLTPYCTTYITGVLHSTILHSTPLHSIFLKIHTINMVAPELSRVGRGKKKVGNRRAGMPTPCYITLQVYYTPHHPTLLDYTRLHFFLSKDPRYSLPQHEAVLGEERRTGGPRQAGMPTPCFTTYTTGVLHSTPLHYITAHSIFPKIHAIWWFQN